MPAEGVAAALKTLAHGGSLSGAEAAAAFTDIMNGDATPAQVAGLLVGLRVKGEAAEEVAGVRDSRVESKIREYHSNLLEAAQQLPNADLAVLECRRRFKNLPQRYFPAVEQLIRSKFTVSTP